MSVGSAPARVAPGAATGARAVPALIAREPVADDAFRSDGDDRISAYQSAQLLGYANFDPEFCRRRVRNVHARHLSGIHAGNLNLGTLRNTGKIGEFRIELDIPRESLVPIADHEQARGKQAETCDNKNADYQWTIHAG
jgi:hypothetical protein